jgi:hypothetical protein
MPTNAVVQRIMSAQATDQSKTLGIILNGRIITTGQYVPRAGKYYGLFYISCGKSDLTVNFRGSNSSRAILAGV